MTSQMKILTRSQMTGLLLANLTLNLYVTISISPNFPMKQTTSLMKALSLPTTIIVIKLTSLMKALSLPTTIIVITMMLMNLIHLIKLKLLVYPILT